MTAGHPHLTVIDVETTVTPFTGGTWLDERPVSTPMAPYRRFGHRRSSWRGPGGDIVHVLLTTGAAGVFGLGQSRGGHVVERLILDHLRPLIRGQDPRDVRIHYEEMRRATDPYAAGGVGAMAVSAIELASWDLIARSLNAPLYRVLGGAPGPVPYYLTAGDPSAAGAAVAQATAEGAGPPRAVKLAMPYGPADGTAGMESNLEILSAARASLGGQPMLAADCFMSWDVPYTIAFARRAADLGLAWIEEPLPAHAIEEHVFLRRAISPVRIAAGEHLFEPSAAYAYLERGALDMLQVDVTWCGGIHAAMSLGFAAVHHGLTFAPHSAGNQPWAVHLLSAFGPLGLAEVLTDVTAAPGPGIPPAPGDGPGVGVDPRRLGFRALTPASIRRCLPALKKRYGEGAAGHELSAGLRPHFACCPCRRRRPRVPQHPPGIASSSRPARRPL